MILSDMGEGGVQNGPKYSDVINEQPLRINHTNDYHMLVFILFILPGMCPPILQILPGEQNSCHPAGMFVVRNIDCAYM